MIGKRENKVFLGGCEVSNWRDRVTPYLLMDYYIPNNNNLINLEYNKKICNFLLYVITPKTDNLTIIAELVYNSVIFGCDDRVIFCILEEDEKFNDEQKKSLNIIKSLIQPHGCNIFDSLIEVINFLNSKKI